MSNPLSYFHGSASNADSGLIGGTGSDPLLFGINVNKGAASAVITVYQGASAAGKIVAAIDASSKSYNDFNGARIPGGMEIVQSGGASDFTVSYI
jgi:hypothetical protein